MSASEGNRETPLDKLRKEHLKWREGPLSKSLQKYPEGKDTVLTSGGLPVKELYTPLDTLEPDFDYLRDLNFPGQYPFARGLDPLVRRDQPFVFKLYSGFGLPEQTNKRYKLLRKEGVQAILVALDLPTQLGFDSDDPVSEGEVGKVGVSINTLRDMQILFDGIPLDSLQEACTTFCGDPTIGMAFFLGLCEKQGIAPEKVRVAFHDYPMAEYTCRGLYIFPIETSMRLSTDLVEWCAKYLPRWVAAIPNELQYRGGGCNVIQGLAFTIADMICFMEWALKRGLDADQAGPTLNGNMCGECDIFQGAAKARAARKIWARIMKERFHARNENTMKMNLHSFTAGIELTKEQPLNNLMRMTLQVLSSMLAGSQNITCAAHDEVLKIPSEEAARLALRTEQIVAHESGVANVTDPLGGSWYVESLTKQIEEGVWDYLEKIDKMGGALQAIENGFYNGEMVAESARRQERLRKQVKVGVNKYRVENEAPIKLLEEDPAVQQKQAGMLRQVRRERDNRAVRQALAEVERVAKTDQNMIPPVLAAVKEMATIGEVYGVLREVFGEYQG